MRKQVWRRCAICVGRRNKGVRAIKQENPRKGVLKRLEELEMLCASLQAETEELRRENNHYKTSYQDVVLEKIRLQEIISDLRERLRKYEPLTVKTVEEAEPSAQELEVPATEKPQDCLADLPFKVAVIGGTDAWQAKVAERHPQFKIVGSSKNFDRDKLGGTDILVINTNAVSHACTQKAKGEVDKGTVVLSISTNNLEILDKKIMALLE